ncbi:MAG: sulfite exporter TauE/SafE family protein [Chloroflexota bacterium]
MSSEVLIIAGTAAFIGLTHAILGPDHYVPFIVLAKARGWSGLKTLVITFLCGLGHILSSVVLGFIGIALGIAVFRLEAIESFRGEIAVWLLIAFGFTYFIWGLHRALRNKPHKHVHVHDGELHSHIHRHTGEHTHVHTSESRTMTPWVLFIVFVFGPCEPLIPLIMYPAARHNMLAVALVALVFGLATIGTMLVIVMASFYGLARFSIRGLERYSHALAGLTILLCGGAVKFLGL